MGAIVQRTILVILISVFPPLLVLPAFRVKVRIAGKDFNLWILILSLQLAFLVFLAGYAGFLSSMDK